MVLMYEPTPLNFSSSLHSVQMRTTGGRECSERMLEKFDTLMSR